MVEIEEILRETGLSEKEVKVYLALLNLGEQTASRISQIADLNRITTYVILKSLKEKGFCSIYDKNKVQYFKPISPEQILGLLDERKNKIKTILPLLKKEEKKISEKPEISMYEGKKGITSMLNLLLNDAENKKEVVAYGNLTIGEELLKYQSLHWRKTRLSKKIIIKAVLDSLKGFEPKKEKKWRKLTQYKINKDLAKSDTYTLITENYVGHLVLKGELSAILIKNKQMAIKERLNFELLWKIAKK